MKRGRLKFSRSLSGKHFVVRFTARAIFAAFCSEGRKFRVRGNDDPSSFSSPELPGERMMDYQRSVISECAADATSERQNRRFKDSFI